MKSLILSGLSTIIFLSVFAQSNKEDLDLIQAIYGKEKKAIVAGFIEPETDVKKTAFWNLYDGYETERKAFGAKRIALLENYVNGYESLDNKKTDEMMSRSMAMQKSLDGLIFTYYDKIKKAVGIKQAAQFYQLECYLLGVTRVHILENIPFIGQLEKSPAAGAAK